MSLNFQLRRKNHAIGEFTASVHFFQPIGASTFASVSDVLRKISSDLDLPAPVPVQVLNLMVGPPGASITPAPQMGGTLGFQRFSKEGEVEESIACDADSIIYVLRDYTVWEDVFPKLLGLMSELASQYIKEVPALQSIRLQYTNEFRGHSAKTKSAAELFLKNARWVAPLAYESNDAWHSHVGLYIPRNAEERYLVNVNCDIAPRKFPGEQKRRSVAKVQIMAGCFFNIPGRKPLIVSPKDITSALKRKFREAHTLEKGVLREIISEPYVMAMGANDDD
jgi:uncharacterized protein (TIGR04255 family)